MRIVRTVRKTNFTIMSNDIIDDSRLSYRALGLLTFLLSKPDGWETDSERLSDGRKEGRDALRTSLSDLEAAGYLTRRRVQDPTTGRWSTLAELTDQPDDGFPGVGPTRENTTKPQVSPRPGKPTVGFPGATTKNGDQGLSTPGHAAPGPLRPERPQAVTRTDHSQELILVPDLNDTKKVTSRTRAPAETNNRPLLAIIEDPDRETIWNEIQPTIDTVTTRPGATA